MAGTPVVFRRAGIVRELRRVFVETAPNKRFYLQGDYDPDKMLARVIDRRYVFLDNWQPAGG